MQTRRHVFRGMGVDGHHRRSTTSPIDLTQFQGIATWIRPSTKSAGGSVTKICVQVQPSVSMTVSWTVPSSLPLGMITGSPRISATCRSAIGCCRESTGINLTAGGGLLAAVFVGLQAGPQLLGPLALVAQSASTLASTGLTAERAPTVTVAAGHPAELLVRFDGGMCRSE